MPLAALLTLALFAGTALSQQITGSIYGLVKDPTGAAIPNAKIVVLLTTRGLSRTAVSSKRGEYLLPELPVGSYQISVTAPGFRNLKEDNIQVDAGQPSHVDLSLSLGDINETVSVDAADEGVDTRSATMGTLIDETSLHELPVDGENVVALAALLPGVTSVSAPASFTGDLGGPSFSASGSRSGQNLFLFDGVLYNNLYRNSGLNYPPRDSLQEVQVLTNNYNAEYGRNAGSIFQVVTKAGGNTFHGTIWEFAKNKKFDAANYALHAVVPLIQNQFGATFGGPILRDRLFFLATYQGYRYTSNTTTGARFFTSASSVSNSRPVQFVDANTDAKVYSPVYDPTTGKQFPGNIIPHSRFDPVAVNIINDFGLTSAAGSSTLILEKTPQNNNLGMIRGDLNLGRHSVDFRFYVLDTDAVGITGQIFNYGMQGTSAKSLLSSASDTMILSPHLINVAHAGYKRFVSFILPIDTRTLSDLGGKFPVIGPPSLPNISITSQFILSSSNNVYNYTLNQNYELNDSVTWSHGQHEFKFGGSYLSLQYVARNWNQSQGVFSFTGVRTAPGGTNPAAGNSLADFLIGAPTNMTVAIPEYQDSALQYNLFGYAQDQWRILPSLTLTLGLRYELPEPWWHQKSEGSTFVPGRQSTVYPNAPAGQLFVGDAGVPKGIVQTDKNNFAPRVGFAWSALRNGKLSVRGGFGIAYDAINANVVFINQPFYYLYKVNSPYSLSDPLHGLAPLPGTTGNTGTQFVGLPTIKFDDPNIRTPYVEQTNFGVQMELPKRTILGVNYVGKFAHKLVLPYTYNPSDYSTGVTLGNQDAHRRFQGLGDLEDFATRGWSNYNGLQVGVTRRAKVLTINGSYTWSRSLDVGSSSDQEGGYLPIPFDLRANYGPSDFNATHIGSLAYVLKLPSFAHRNWAVRTVFGGWLYSGIYSIRTGIPVTPVLGYDAALSTTPNQRPNILKDWRLPSGRHRTAKMAEYFSNQNCTAANASLNPNCVWETPVQGTYGNASRNLVIGPPNIGNSMAMAKDFALPKLRPGTQIQFRCDAFGIFNTPNLTSFNTTALQVGPSMGQIFSTNGERILQLSLHLYF